MSRQFQEIDEAASYLRRGRMFSLPASALGFESAFAQALAGGQVRPGDWLVAVRVLTRAAASASQPDERFLLLTQEDSETPELIQNDKCGSNKMIKSLAHETRQIHQRVFSSGDNIL